MAEFKCCSEDVSPLAWNDSIYLYINDDSGGGATFFIVFWHSVMSRFYNKKIMHE